MGGCASSVNSTTKDSKTMTKLRLAFSPHKGDTIIVSSPLKPSLNDHRSISLRSHPASDFQGGSKEDTFFDSKAWLDSDCDEDFLSVKGDFTPSQGNTPVHHKFSVGTPQINKNIFNDSSPEPSPNTKKKRLSELFQESLREEKGADFEDHKRIDNLESTKIENKSSPLGRSPRPVNDINLISSKETASKNGNYRALKDKTVNSSKCCIPILLSSRSFNERSKTSPAQRVG